MSRSARDDQCSALPNCVLHSNPQTGCNVSPGRHTSSGVARIRSTRGAIVREGPQPGRLKVPGGPNLWRNGVCTCMCLIYVIIHYGTKIEMPGFSSLFFFERTQFLFPNFFNRIFFFGRAQITLDPGCVALPQLATPLPARHPCPTTACSGGRWSRPASGPAPAAPSPRAGAPSGARTPPAPPTRP